MNKVYWAIRLGLNYLRDNTGGRVYWEPLGEDTLKFSTQAECNAYQMGARICSAHTIMVEKIGKYWVDLGHGYTTPPKSSEQEKVPTPASDSDRLDWLLNRGVAWRDCYDKSWKEGEWLYDFQDARNQIDNAMHESVPASDSVKGERDRHGRTIIARNDFAMVVECPDGMYQVADTDGNWWYLSVQSRWVGEDCPEAGTLNREYAIKKLALAASTPLPTANPAASAKDDPFPMGAGDPGMGPGESHWEAILKLEAELASLKREVAALKAVK